MCAHTRAGAQRGRKEGIERVLLHMQKDDLAVGGVEVGILPDTMMERVYIP